MMSMRTYVRHGALAVVYKRTPAGKRFLIARHFTGRRGFISGGMKRGENAEACLFRELSEEIGMSQNDIVHVQDYKRNASFFSRLFFFSFEFRYRLFAVEARDGFEWRRSFEVRGCAWVDAAEAMRVVHAGSLREIVAAIASCG